MEELLREIERAIRTRGWSARQVSMKAGGSPDLIRGMRRGRVPSVERVEALCQALDLEFYVGAPGAERPVATERLGRGLGDHRPHVGLDRTDNGLRGQGACGGCGLRPHRGRSWAGLHEAGREPHRGGGERTGGPSLTRARTVSQGASGIAPPSRAVRRRNTPAESRRAPTRETETEMGGIGARLQGDGSRLTRDALRET